MPSDSTGKNTTSSTASSPWGGLLGSSSPTTSGTMQTATHSTPMQNYTSALGDVTGGGAQSLAQSQATSLQNLVSPTIPSFNATPNPITTAAPNVATPMVLNDQKAPTAYLADQGYKIPSLAPPFAPMTPAAPTLPGMGTPTGPGALGTPSAPQSAPWPPPPGMTAGQYAALYGHLV